MNNKEKWSLKKEQAFLGGGQNRIEAQHARGKKTARERISLLVDDGSFEEIDQLVASPFITPSYETDGVVAGFATIAGKRVALYSQDFTIRGGSLGNFQAKKICKVMDMAAKIGCPIIGILDSGGARIEEGIHSLAGYGDIFLRNVRYSGVIPQISIVLGPCAGGAVYSPALTDFIFTTENISQLFITGPQVIKEVLHEEITKDELGGARIHAEKSGLVHSVSSTEEDCFDSVKMLLSYLPNNYLTPSESIEPENSKEFSLSSLVPSSPHKAYDIKTLIEALCDNETFFEIHELFAPNIVIGFARLDGKVVGLVANQPLIKAGTLDINASCKAARFIQFCDAFNIPIISLVDVPGYLPGVEEEHNGIIRHGAKLLHAYAQATIPKITVIVRKAYGGAYIVMGSKHLGADFNFAWPEAHIAVMGSKGAVQILGRRELQKCADQENRLKVKKKLEKEYEEKMLNPFTAAEFGYIDSIIQPEETRNHLIRALEITSEKIEVLPKRKFSNIPL